MRWFLYISGMCLLAACGSNIFESALEPSTDKAKLVEAEKYLDEGNYAKALEWVEKVDSTSNKRQVLEAAARLGAADMGVWQIFTSILALPDQSSDTLSVNSIYDELSSTSFGEGEQRQAKLLALRKSIEALQIADDLSDARVENLLCFIAGLLSVGSAVEGADAVTGLETSLTDVLSNAEEGATTDSECPGIEALDQSFDEFDSLAQSISLLGNLGVECKYFSAGSSGSNKAETSFTKVLETSDKGCSSECTGSYCAAFELGCVSSRLDSASAVSSDGELAACELVRNCVSGGCF